MKMRLTVAVISILLTIVVNYNGIEAQEPTPIPRPLVSDVPHAQSMAQLAKLATDLESIGVTKRRQAGEQVREVYDFVRPSHAMHALKRIEHLEAKIDEFIGKAAQINARDKSGKIGLFSSMSNWGTFNHLAGIAGNEAGLAALVQKYRDNNDKGRNVECDLVKFMVEQVQQCAQVLQVAIKFIVVGDTSQVNLAIFDNLRATNFVSKFNFHSQAAQQQFAHKSKVAALNQFYQSKALPPITVADAIDHAIEPSQLVITRLLETCTALKTIDAKLDQLSKEQTSCSSTNSSSNSEPELNSNWNRRDDIHKLCHQLLAVV